MNRWNTAQKIVGVLISILAIAAFIVVPVGSVETYGNLSNVGYIVIGDEKGRGNAVDYKRILWTDLLLLGVGWVLWSVFRSEPSLPVEPAVRSLQPNPRELLDTQNEALSVLTGLLEEVDAQIEELSTKYSPDADAKTAKLLDRRERLLAERRAVQESMAMDRYYRS